MLDPPTFTYVEHALTEIKLVQKSNTIQQINNRVYPDYSTVVWHFNYSRFDSFSLAE